MRDYLLPPSLGVFSPLSVGKSGQPQVFFYQPLSIQNANTALHPLAAQQVICYTLWSHCGKRFVELCFAVYQSTVCSRRFCWLCKYLWRNYSVFNEGCVWERDFWVFIFKSVSSVPWRTYHLNKDPFYEENCSLTHSCRKTLFFFEKDRIYFTSCKGIVRVSSFIQKSAAFKNYFQFSVKHSELEDPSSLKFLTHLRFL